MLFEKHLIGCGARAVGSRVSPPVKQASPLAVPAAGIAGRLGRCHPMIDNPYFAEFMNADQNLIKRFNVFDGVEVGPVRAAGPGPR